LRGLRFPCRLIGAARHSDSIRDVNGRGGKRAAGIVVGGR
jgi:hypothetical protein